MNSNYTTPNGGSFGGAFNAGNGNNGGNNMNGSSGSLSGMLGNSMGMGLGSAIGMSNFMQSDDDDMFMDEGELSLAANRGSFSNSVLDSNVSYKQFVQNASDQMALHGLPRAHSANLEESRSNLKDLEDAVEKYKKENFSLKMRLYYMEESMTKSGINKDTVDLNIRIQELTSELEERNMLVVKLKNALELLQHEHSKLAKNCICDSGRKSPATATPTRLQSPTNTEHETLKQQMHMLQQQLQNAQQQLQNAQMQSQQAERLRKEEAGSMARKIKELEDSLKSAAAAASIANVSPPVSRENDANIQRILGDNKALMERAGMLEESLLKYKKDFGAQLDKNSQLEKEREREREREKARASSIANLQQSNETLKNSFDMLKDNYVGLKAKADALKLQLEKVTTRCLELEAVLATKEAELNALREELNAVTAHSHQEERHRIEDITAMRNQIKRLKERRDQMADEAATKDAEYGKAVEEMAHVNHVLQNEKKQMQVEIEKSSQVLASFERLYRELQDDVNGSLKRQEGIEREREIYRQQSEQLALQLQQAADKLKKLQSDNRQLEMMKNNVREQQVSTETKSLDCFREVLIVLNTKLGVDNTAEINNLMSSTNDPSQLKNVVISKINHLQRETNELLSTTIAEAEARVANQVEQILAALEEKVEQLDTLERKYYDLQPGKLIELVGQSKMERDQIASEMHSTRINLHAQLAGLQAELHSTRSDLQEQLANLQVELGQKNDELGALKRRLNSATQVPSEANQLLQLRQEITRLQKDSTTEKSKMKDDHDSKIQNIQYNYEVKIQKLEKEIERLSKDQFDLQQANYQQKQQQQQQIQYLQQQQQQQQLHLQQQQQQQQQQQLQQQQQQPAQNANSFFSSRLGIDTIDLPKTPKTPSRKIDSPQFDINLQELDQPDTWIKLRDKFAQLSNDHQELKEQIHKVDHSIKQEKLKSPNKSPSSSSPSSSSSSKLRESKKPVSTMQQHINFLQYLLDNKQAISSMEQNIPDFRKRMDNALNEIKQMDSKKKLLVFELKERSDKLNNVIDSYNNLVTDQRSVLSTPVDPMKSQSQYGTATTPAGNTSFAVPSQIPRSANNTKSILSTPSNNANLNANNNLRSYKSLGPSSSSSAQWNNRNTNQKVSFNNSNPNNKENMVTEGITTEPITPRSSIRQPISINGRIKK